MGVGAREDSGNSVLPPGHWEHLEDSGGAKSGELHQISWRSFRE